MKRRIALVFLLLWGCSPGGLVEAEGRLVVRPTQIDFGAVYVGHPADRTLLVENRGRGALTIEASVEGPFTIDAASFALGGGERREIRVGFDPAEEGTVEGRIRFSGGIEVPISAEARIPPECPPSNLCRTVTFDPESGECVEERAPEGSHCGDACFAGVCIEGECLGETISCDDGNDCTVDLCDPASGCAHWDDSERCLEGVEKDPCRVPICDPVEGCTFEWAVDGTACGPSNCTTRFVCLQGICTEITTPNGGECGEETPCRAKGICVDGECLQEPPRVLEPTWRIAAAPGSTLVFDGVTDAVGQPYWAECTATSCDLVSVTVNGFERYRETLFVEDVGRVPTGSLALAGDRVISTLRPGHVEAFHSATAERVWSCDLAEVLGAGDADGEARWVDEAAPPVILADAVLVAVDGFRRPAGSQDVLRWGGWVVSLDAATGKVRWVWEGDGRLEGFVGDEAGSVFFALRPHDAAPTEGGFLVSLGANGTERWRRPSPIQAPLLTLGGRIFQASGQLRASEDGGEFAHTRVLVPTWPRRTPLSTGSSLWVVGVPLEPCDTGWCPSWIPHLVRFDADSGHELWRNQITSESMSEPLLTKELSIMYARQDPLQAGNPWHLVELDANSRRVFQCRLPEGGRYDGATSLAAGQWITVDRNAGAVMAFAVQGRLPPSSGWVMGGGTPERTSRPR